MTHDNGAYDKRIDYAFRRRADRRMFDVVGLILDPAVVIRDTVTGQTETHVLGSRNLTEWFEELRPHAS